MSETIRLTVAQALVKFLGAQYSESDGVEQKAFRRLLRDLRSWKRRRYRPGPTAGRTGRA